MSKKKKKKKARYRDTVTEQIFIPNLLPSHVARLQNKGENKIPIKALKLRKPAKQGAGGELWCQCLFKSESAHAVYPKLLCAGGFQGLSRWSGSLFVLIRALYSSGSLSESVQALIYSWMLWIRRLLEETGNGGWMLSFDEVPSTWQIMHTFKKVHPTFPPPLD